MLGFGRLERLEARVSREPSKPVQRRSSRVEGKRSRWLPFPPCTSVALRPLRRGRLGCAKVAFDIANSACELLGVVVWCLAFGASPSRLGLGRGFGMPFFDLRKYDASLVASCFDCGVFDR